MMRLLFALGIGLALAAPAQAQTASLSGTVVDESGAVVPGATVMLAGPGGKITYFDAAEVAASVAPQDYGRAWPMWRKKALDLM